MVSYLRTKRRKCISLIDSSTGTLWWWNIRCIEFSLMVFLGFAGISFGIFIILSTVWRKQIYIKKRQLIDFSSNPYIKYSVVPNHLSHSPFLLFFLGLGWVEGKLRASAKRFTSAGSNDPVLGCKIAVEAPRSRARVNKRKTVEGKTE